MRDLKIRRGVKLLRHHAGFYIVLSDVKYYKSIMTLRSKLLRAKVKWKYHIVLTVSPDTYESFKKLDAIGERGLSGEWVGSFCRKVNDIYRRRNESYRIKYFWKYEEGQGGDWESSPHFHLLTDWKWSMGIVVNRTLAIWKKSMQMGMVKVIPIRTGIHLANMFGYGGKAFAITDLTKPTATNRLPKGRRKYMFSRNIEFSEKKSTALFSKWTSPVHAKQNLIETKDEFIAHYKRKGIDGRWVFKQQIKMLDKIIADTYSAKNNYGYNETDDYIEL